MSYSNEQFSTQKKTSSSLSVYQCGHQISGANHSYGPAVREHFVIHYIVKGKGKYFVNQQEYALSEGQGFLILPGDSTYYVADSENPWEYYWVGFDGLEAKRLLELANLGKERLIFGTSEPERLENALNDLYFSSKQYASREFAMIGYLYLFFSSLIVSSDMPHKKTIEEYFNQSVNYIKTNISAPLTVQEISHYVGVERSYLHRIFKQMIGCSVYEYVQEYRMEQARRMLELQRFTITEIANSLGFDSTAHFSRVFKKRLGISPSNYPSSMKQQGIDELMIVE